MTENELNELRELLVERANHPMIELDLPPRIWELLNLHDKAIAQLRIKAANLFDQFYKLDEDSHEAALVYAKAHVLQAEADLLKVKAHLQKLELGDSQINGSNELPDDDLA